MTAESVFEHVTAFIGALFVDFLGLVVFGIIVCAGFFIWLNKRNASFDQPYYEKKFNPEKVLKANVHHGKAPEDDYDAEKALRSYSHPVGTQEPEKPEE